MFDAPVTSLSINQTWVGHVTGELEKLAQSEKWLGTEEEIQATIDNILLLIDALSIT